MMDQYGHKVPDDLVVLDVKPVDIPDDYILLIGHADWYEVECQGHRLIMVGAKQVGYILDTDPRDCDFPDDWESKAEVRLIDDPLKRWSAEDGFYHA